MRTWLALGLILVVAACGSPEPSPTVTERPRPKPSPTQEQTDLVAALRRTQAAPYRFAVQATLPENEKVKATGAFDTKEQIFTSETTLTSPKNPSSTERIVLGTDAYQREPGDPWVHLDLTRIKKNSLFYFDLTDPTGLSQFAETVTFAKRSGPATYTGRFRPDGETDEPFLPIGAPSLWSSGMRVSPFTITVDDQGWVTAISVELSPSDSPTLTMKTTLSAHGQPLSVSAPDAREADPGVYE
ncbi:hypothetical protein [Cryptosporangium aurantiacum]|uniref:Lipoprotein LprG n=1 Tax=Cryptosporangium aurantiacum TaxID=134849 RepID=A0A1M7NJC7_9ACTN|nr:hypothetical protein [Cryptosporangium aurantiacum]SHN04027.1 hypothetical protein SAMN05443668_102679 [Cryptosporangium aurantiacum]